MNTLAKWTTVGVVGAACAVGGCRMAGFTPDGGGVGAGGSSAGGAYLSPSVVLAAPDGKTLYVAEETANRVAVVDAATLKVLRTLDVPAAPTGLALGGELLFVTCAAPESTLCAFQAADGRAAFTVKTGHTSGAPVVSPDGKTLYVCNRFNDDVSVIDLAARRETARIPVLREPMAAAISPDGKTLFVANLLPTGSLAGDYAGAAVSAVDTATRKAAAIALPNGSSSVRGVCLSPDGRFAYVTHILSRYQLPTTQLERGWMNTSALSVIDVAERKLVNTVLLDDVDLGAANPWGVACTADGRSVCVTHSSTHELSVIDRAALHAKLERAAKGEKVSDASASAADVPNDLSFLVDLRRRVHLAGSGPRGVAVSGARAFAAEYFSDSLGVVDLATDSVAAAQSAPLGPKVPVSVARRGEMLFHDADMCFQKWQSCASCHPDARVDGLNWDLLNDGLGNPKQTKSMLLSHRTPPVMLSGVREQAEAAVRSGMKFIQFTVRPEADAVAIDEYLKTLRPVPSPHLVRGKPGADALRGQKVFETAGCAACHPAPLYTDLDEHDVGTAQGIDKGKLYDTPTLVECWRSAPYLSDGRAATLMDVITSCNTGNVHGTTSTLDARDRHDLVEFLLAL